MKNIKYQYVPVLRNRNVPNRTATTSAIESLVVEPTTTKRVLRNRHIPISTATPPAVDPPTAELTTTKRVLRNRDVLIPTATTPAVDPPTVELTTTMRVLRNRDVSISTAIPQAVDPPTVKPTTNERVLRNRNVPNSIEKTISLGVVLATKTAKRRRSENTHVFPNAKRAKGQNGQLVPIVHRQFKLGELVVTKVKGWSAWPAQITSLNQSGRKYQVRYFGFQNMSGAAGANEIYHWDTYSIAMLQEVLKNKSNQKGYIQSLREVEAIFNFTFPFEITN